jgi:nucleoside-diphosphate-sugar epimerase
VGPRTRVVLTGSQGTIGRALHARLSTEHDVLGLDRVAGPTTQWCGDIADPDLLARAFHGAQAVVHTAALHAPHVGRVPDAEFERVNVEGTRAVIAAARAARVRHIVYTSTTALYGHAVTPGRCTWIDERTVPQPRTVYHRTKLAAEALLRAAADETLAVTVLRMSRCFPEPLPLMALYRLHRGIDARDVAEAHVRALLVPPSPWRCLIVSGDTPFEPDDCERLALDAAHVLRQRAPTLVEAFLERGWPLPSTIDRVYCARAAQLTLGWRPRHGFETVLADAAGRTPG